MTTNTVLERYPEIDYVLVWRHDDESGWQEYVAAWHYDDATGTWGQGHYFNKLTGAVNYIQEKYGYSAEKICKQLLERGRNYINDAETERYEYKAADPERFFTRGIELWAMEDMIEYLEDIVDTDEISNLEANLMYAE